MTFDELRLLVAAGTVVRLELYPAESRQRTGKSLIRIVRVRDDQQLGWVFTLSDDDGSDTWDLWRATRMRTRVFLGETVVDVTLH